MRFAHVNGTRELAKPGLLGACQGCNQPLIPKCGEQKQWHWAHKSKTHCDPWWESETQWHLNWKACFPDSWSEIVHAGPNGERHIADVKTEYGWVLEFQHSAIAPDERRSRDNFYERLAWIVDGARRKRDLSQFERAWNDGVKVGDGGMVRSLFVGDAALLREWWNCKGPILFDFGGAVVAWLLPVRNDLRVYVAKFPRAHMVQILLTGEADPSTSFDSILGEVAVLITSHDRNRRF